jgi:hypothetical protein
VVGGTLAALASALLLGRHSTAGVLGLATLSLWIFLGRGGLTLPFYLVPLLPLLALNVALVAGVAAERYGRSVPALAAAAWLFSLGVGYSSVGLGFRDNPLTLWQNAQADAQEQAIAWLRRNVPSESRMVVDQSLWTDLRAGPDRVTRFPNAHPYWKVERDRSVRDGVFRGDWRAVEYVVTTPQLLDDARSANLTLVSQALDNSTAIARFDTGRWPVEVRRVADPGRGQDALERPMGSALTANPGWIAASPPRRPERNPRSRPGVRGAGPRRRCPGASLRRPATPR